MHKRPELILFGIIAVVYIVCTTTALSWANNAQDTISFMDSVKYFAGTATVPVYAALAHVGTWFPNEVWGVAFMGSTLPAIGSCILVFYVVRKQTKNVWAPYIASATLGASALFLAHSSVVEFRTSVAFFIIAGYTALVYNRGMLGALCLGLAVGCHNSAPIPVILVLLVWSQKLRENWWMLLLSAAVPLALHNQFSSTLWGGTASSLKSIVGFWGSRAFGFIDNNFLPVMAVLAVSLGLSIIPLILHMRRFRIAYPFVIIAMFPLVYSLTSRSDVGHVQFVAIMPLLAVAAGLGVSALSKRVAPVLLGASMITLVLLPISWDSPSASAQDFLEQLDTIEDNAVVICSRYTEDFHGSMGLGTPTKISVLFYNRESGRSIGTLHPSAYGHPEDFYGERKALQELGFVTPPPRYPRSTTFDEWESLMVRSFIEANPDTPVYGVRVTDAKEFVCVLEKQ